MKKLINAVDDVLTESLQGFAAVHGDIVALGEENKFVRRKSLKPGKVALISGGGSGHEPLHAGFVGLGMLDAACPGQVFTSPTPDQMLAAAQAADTGAGALFTAAAYGWTSAYCLVAACLGVGMLTTLFIAEPEARVDRATLAQEARVVAFLERSAHWPRALRQAMAWVIGAVVCPFVDFFSRQGLRLGVPMLLLILMILFRPQGLLGRAEERTV